MWMIGAILCVGLMLVGGHAVMNAGHETQSEESAAAQSEVAPATAPDDAATEAAPENAPDSKSRHHHH